MHFALAFAVLPDAATVELRTLAGRLVTARTVDAVLAATAGALPELAPEGFAVVAVPVAPSDWHTAAAGALPAAVRESLSAFAQTIRATPRAAPPGTEFVAAPLRTWLESLGVDPASIAEEPVTIEAGVVGMLAVSSPNRAGIDHVALAAVAGMAGAALRAVYAQERLRRIEGAQQDLHEFLSRLFHDLRTPLTSIRGYAQLVLRQARADVHAPLHPNLQMIVEQSDRLAGMTEVLLDVARMQIGRLALRRTTVDLGQVVRQAVADGGEPDAVPPILELPDSGPLVDVDAARITRAVQALLDFARWRSEAAPPPRLQVAADGKQANITIEDFGPALSPDERDALFSQLVDRTAPGKDRVFLRAHLVIARAAVEAHGGQLVVESPVPGRSTGTRATVSLPR